MANHKSAKKRARQDVVRNAHNKAQRSKVRSLIKKVRQAIESKDKNAALELFKSTQSYLNRLGRKRVVEPNAAKRTTSRLATQVSKL